ncbi:hypothetical protein MMC13_000573 [Lambiella insularis]|nr:hypothetical protein [Lambiella insularis]
MASNREERFLMRQRGAGARQLRNSGFEFILPGSSRSPLKPLASGRSRRTPVQNNKIQSSTRKTPKFTPLVPQQSSRRTPASRKSKQSGASSSRQLVSISEQQDASTSQATKTDGQGSVTKKRKIGRPAKTPSTERAEPTGAVAIFGSIRKSSEPAVPHDQGEPTEISTALPAKKRKKRKSIGQQSRKRTRTSLLTANDVSPAIPVHANPIATQQQRTQSGESIAEAVATQPLTDPPPAVENAKRRQKKAKTIGRPKSKRKPLEAISSSSQPGDISEPLPVQKQVPNAGKARNCRKALASVEEIEEPEEESEGVSKDLSSRPRKAPTSTIFPASSQPRPRGRPRKTDVAASPTSPQRASIPKKPRPKAAKRSIPPQSTSSTADQSERPQRRQKPGTIPITVHRISQPQSHNNLHLDEDPPSAPPPFPKNSSINAIDVLSQICSEMLAKSTLTMRESARQAQNPQQKAELRRKAKAVEMFRDELDERLFQMTSALDTSHALSTRLRHATKQKTAARSTLLALKRRRDALALETDAVRAVHERAAKVAQDENELDTLVQDIELAVRRGRAAQRVGGGDEGGREVGLELRLRKVAAEFGDGEEGGLLERVKAFNGLMERAVGGS